MSIFGSILSKLGLGGDQEVVASADTTVATPSAPPSEAPATASAPAPISQVDVMAKLTAMAAVNGQKLNWKTSIVDLMKLLGIDSSYSARKELAAELECPAEKLEDSAQMNIWLHNTVLQKLAANG